MQLSLLMLSCHPAAAAAAAAAVHERQMKSGGSRSSGSEQRVLQQRLLLFPDSATRRNGLRQASQGRDSPIFLQFFYLFSIFFLNGF
jgi:hypothetical protein